MEDDYKFKILGSTWDDAVGECFDKVARVLDLGYPGGPKVEKLALEGKDTYSLPIPMNNDSLDFSYSGLKSSIINLVHNENQRGNEIRKADLACSFQNVAFDELIRKTSLAIDKYKIKNLIVAGGVSASCELRKKLEQLAQNKNVHLTVPNFKYCTDNAAMIGAAAYPLFKDKKFSSLALNAKSVETLQ